MAIQISRCEAGFPRGDVATSLFAALADLVASGHRDAVEPGLDVIGHLAGGSRASQGRRDVDRPLPITPVDLSRSAD